MSHLDDLISRFTAQRDILNCALRELADEHFAPRLVAVELGLGSGRTYDHLRAGLGGRELFAFDHRVETHPGFEPPADRIILGDISETFPRFATSRAAGACLIHIDIGTRNRAADLPRYERIVPWVGVLAARRALVISDRALDADFLEAVQPGGQPLGWPYALGWPYFLYRHKT